MLTDAERDLLSRTFSGGPAVLVEEGYSEDDIRAFFKRSDVQAFWALLQRELDHRDALEIRSKFMLRRQLGTLSRGAVAILGQALAGPQYLTVRRDDGTVAVQRDARGNPILSRPEITGIQLRAAEVILESLGVPYARAKNDQAPGVGAGVDNLFKGGEESTVQIAEDPAHENPAQRALSRERVRSVIAVLASRVPELHEKLNENLGAVAAAKPKRKAPSGKKTPKGPK